MATMANGVPTNPTVGAWFTMHDVDGRWIKEGEIGFESLEGLARTTEAIKYKEGNDLLEKHIPGRTMAGQITIRKATDDNNSLGRWKAAIEEPTGLADAEVKVDLIVTMFDRRGTPGSGGSDIKKPIRQWKLTGAWISELTYSALNGLANEVHTESATIVYDGPPLQLLPALDLSQI